MTEQPIRFRDLKPYYTVDSLDDLEGPEYGTITLPVTIFWSSPDRKFDVDIAALRRQAYPALLSNAGPAQLRKLGKRNRLLEDWASIGLDQRIVDLWNNRHPQLAGIRREW